MRIHWIRVAHFRGIAEGRIDLSPMGVTVVEGPNEAGKSSFIEAFHVLLHELDSTRKQAVLDVRPVDRDVGTEIEAEIEAGTYRFRYLKRFFRGAATELRVTEPAAEQHTGRAAHERAQQILRETLDLDLLEALSVRQGGAIDQADLSHARPLLESMDEAAGRATAGDRETALFEAVATEYDQYFTPGRGEPRKARKQAAQAEAEAAARVEALTVQLVALQEDVERSGEVEREIREATAAEANASAAAEKCARDVAGIEERERALKVHKIELTGLQIKASTARKRAQERHELAAKLERASATRARIEGETAGSGPALKAVEDEAARAAADLANAEAAAGDALRLRDLRDRDFEYEDLRLKLELLSERRQRVAAARAEAERARAELATNRVTDELLAQVRAAQERETQAAARFEAMSAQLSVRALAPIDAEIAGEKRKLAAGDTVDAQVKGETRVRVPGVIEIAVRPGAGTEGPADELAAARAELQRLLAEAGAADAAGAEALRTRRRDAAQAAKAAEEAERENLRDLTFADMEARIDRLRHKVEGYPADRPAEPPPATGFDAARDAQAAARRLQETAEERLRAARRRLTELTARERELREKTSEASVQLRVALEEERRFRAELEVARAGAGDESLEEAALAAEAELRAAEEAHAKERSALAAADPARVRRVEEEARRAAAHAADRLRARQDERLQIRTRLEKDNERGLFEELQEAKTRQRRAAAKVRALETRAAAAGLLYETMRECRDAARDLYSAPLREGIVGLGREVFGADFTVELGDDLGIATRTLDGRTLPFKSLSVGAREQLGVLARLACALLVDPAEGVPLLFDDTLGHADPERLRAMARVLERAGDRCQIIVLTCMPDRFAQVAGARVVGIH